jgi:methylenetetrahydrofolate dehydrogenase (NADP+)/methenyltetrahydrofolate cyclohydrolase
MLLLKEYVGDIAGKEALVIGRSLLFGKPAAQLLLAANATVTMAHSRSKDLPMLARRADILVAAIGKPQFVKADWIKPGATVIDVGINRIDAGGGKTRLVGDVDYEAAKEVAGAITPVPGGVGAMTIICLMQNTLLAACAQNELPLPGF